MKILVVFFFLSPLFCMADVMSNRYWSNSACDGYIYHFDTSDNKYAIYSRLKVKDKHRGSYQSYQLTNGAMHKSGNNLIYSLTGNDLVGRHTVDFSSDHQVIFESAQYGRSVLVACDPQQAKRLIQEAEEHFKSCPKNVLNCKSQ